MDSTLHMIDTENCHHCRTLNWEACSDLPVLNGGQPCQPFPYHHPTLSMYFPLYLILLYAIFSIRPSSTYTSDWWFKCVPFTFTFTCRPWSPTSLATVWSEWRSETGHLTLSSLPTILAYLPWVQGVINITQEPALSFFKSFPWKCSTPLNGPANAVAVMFWTAALLQDKLCSARSLSADFSAQRCRGCERQPAMARWKSLINFFTSWCWLLLKCHLPGFHSSHLIPSCPLPWLPTPTSSLLCPMDRGWVK